MEELRILVIDDHPEVLSQIEDRLSQEDGFKICKSASMENVYAHITNYQPDVLLIDPFMEDGLCIKSLKQIQQMLPSLTVIVLAAVVDAASKLELSKIGIKFILEKKVASDQLVDTLRLVEAIKRGGNGRNNK
jgi:DNA-binding NarL/FixJ family response regulator